MPLRKHLVQATGGDVFDDSVVEEFQGSDSDARATCDVSDAFDDFDDLPSRGRDWVDSCLPDDDFYLKPGSPFRVAEIKSLVADFFRAAGYESLDGDLFYNGKDYMGANVLPKVVATGEKMFEVKVWKVE